MTMLAAVSSAGFEEKKKMDEERVKVTPEVCSYVDDEHTKITIGVSIPGVSKKDITLRMHEDSSNLIATA